MGDTANPLLPAAYDVGWSLVFTGGVVLAVIGLVSLSRNARRLSRNQALVWSLATLLIPVLGPLGWLTIGRQSVRAPAEE